jgi:hypothetical protein
VRASGTAPGAIYWELGVRPGRPALLHFIGDAYVARASDESVENDAEQDVEEPQGERQRQLGQREQQEKQPDKDGKRAAA